LKYDWLIDYAYYFLFHFNRTPEIAAKDIPVWPRNYSSPTLYKTFKFEAAGWWASEEGENADDYRERVTNEFEKALDEYIVAGTLFMGLEHKTKFTKPTSMKTVPWLVRRVFFGWSAEQIVEHFFPEIDRTRSKLAARSFISKRKYVEDEMRELKKYKLPVL
jgi:hypothetical protein